MNTQKPIHRLATWPSPWPPIVGSRQAVAGMWGRHPDQVKRHCEPVACDVKTRTPLYDADEVGAILLTRRRRVA